MSNTPPGSGLRNEERPIGKKRVYLVMIDPFLMGSKKILGMATRSYEGKKFDLQVVEPVSDALTVEEALQIAINGKPFTLSMRTPGADRELVRGMLHSEDIINSPDFHPEVQLHMEKEEGIVAVAALSIPEQYLGDGYANSRSLLSVSSCGICGKTELGDQDFGSAIASDLSFSAERFSEMFEQMNRHQHDFMQSGGTHAAALLIGRAGLSLPGKILAVIMP